MSSSAFPESKSETPVVIGVAVKWAAHRVDVDPLSGAVQIDLRLNGPSDADLAALEWGLRLTERWGGELIVATAGPVEADGVLRLALAAGAHRALRCDLHYGAPSEMVASCLAQAFAAADLVLCGDRSPDNSSGTVPSYLAERLGAAQALGLVSLEPENVGTVQALRRLDGGRRERLRVSAPAVLSVEAGVARLRRSSFDALLHSLSAQPGYLQASVPHPEGVQASLLKPYRPRSRFLPVPNSSLTVYERLLAVTGVHSARRRSELVTLAPSDAADRILSQLRAWGYLEP